MIERLFSRHDIFSLALVIMCIGLIQSCSNPDFHLDNDESEILNFLKGKKIEYKNESDKLLYFVFNKKIDTTVIDNRGLFNSFYDKTWAIKSRDNKLYISFTKSTLGSSSMEVSLFGNKTIISKDSLLVNEIIMIKDFEVNNEMYLDYLILEKGKGIVEFKIVNDPFPYYLLPKKISNYKNLYRPQLALASRS
jgi:hypothetical protein